MPDNTDYRPSLFLPKTDFPMRGESREREVELLARWDGQDIYNACRALAQGRPKFIVHDGPPYANGDIHMGHALNKVLKDVLVRSRGMLGFDSNYVPGWDCHGLPIEWKVEEAYRKSGRTKDSVSVRDFRHDCRRFADRWIGTQRAQFMRLGILADWDRPYTTMSFAAEAQIVRELWKFAANGTLYRGSKPVMWSVVEGTALAEAEIEYHNHVSDMVWVKFPIEATDAREACALDLRGATVAIWTTTPWTIPANRAISYSPKIAYSLYEVTASGAGTWAREGDRLVIADQLAADTFKNAGVGAYRRIAPIPGDVLSTLVCAHPLKGFAAAYAHAVPLLAADYVTDDAGTGFVHCAPGHGRDDFDVWTANAPALAARGIDPAIPYMIDGHGQFTSRAAGFAGRCVITGDGATGDANDAIIEALLACSMLIGRGRISHQYPHSWRSKKPVIYRNTPQWFIAMDKPISDGGKAVSGDTLRARALNAIAATSWLPAQGENRIVDMIESRPDWVVSRQRSWGVPIAIFVREQEDGSVEFLDDPVVNARIAAAFEQEGADAWFEVGAAERFLAPDHDPASWTKVDDILDVWFESGSTHAFTLEVREDLSAVRKHQGGDDTIVYMEGSDQHRGWFHSSLLESSGTRNRAPFDIVLTHGFVLDADGRKMSKSEGNVISPEDILRESNADVLRMWVCTSDYTNDLRIGPKIMKTTAEAYRKVRNTIRWMLGNLSHFSPEDRVAIRDMPELERLMLHRLAELDTVLRRAYLDFDYNRVVGAISFFLTNDLSAFYFDIRKDALYCEPISSVTRKACLTVLDHLFRCTAVWLAPILCFTAEEAWLARNPTATSIHFEPFPDIPLDWADHDLAKKWRDVRLVRRVITAALEIARAQGCIGASLEAASVVYVFDPKLRAALDGVDLAEIAITSAAVIVDDEGPTAAFRLPEIPGIAVEVHRAEGRRCARSRKVLPDVGSDRNYPDVSARDAKALHEWARSTLAAA